MWAAGILRNHWYYNILLQTDFDFEILIRICFHFINVVLFRCTSGARRTVGQIYADGRVSSIFVWIFNSCKCHWSLLQAWRFTICVGRNILQNQFW